ncbi:ribosome maturation factor RimP [Psychromicrobium silvestre]|uniref:Ribosome maturation factor RimP n=1 Tax=Psychromicrobium silvestre TaxID=1645614 RepID=A0A7Y9LW53_9MICC|nr:ribosome maturation factor RimP [Psychromicrobium silvestre]NYE96703.1 ribosome maturation factor RimP [Psychromicrobium silvestre]
MSKPDRSQRLYSLLEPIVIEQGLYLEDVSEHLAGAQRTVQVVVDLPETEGGSVSLDAIAEIAQQLSAALDQDPEDDGKPYDLEVSSPGVSRPLTELRHWRRALGRMVRVNVLQGENLSGRLVEVQEKGILLRSERIIKKGMKPKISEPEFIGFEKIRRGNVEVEFAQAEDAGTHEQLGEEPDQKGQE